MNCLRTKSQPKNRKKVDNAEKEVQTMAKEGKEAGRHVLKTGTDWCVNGWLKVVGDIEKDGIKVRT